MTCWLTPEFHSPANIRTDAHYADRVLQRADGIIAVSENSRRDAIKVLGLREDRIIAIHPGVASHFFDVPRQEIERVQKAFQLSRPYVLCVGTIEPRKNIDRLLQAWAGLRKDLRDAFDLVIAGPLGWASEATTGVLRQNQNQSVGAAGGAIRYLGYVAEPDLPGLTAGSVALAYPSFYEGFGFPVAQAMASGVAVVTSNTSCLPEVAEDAAEYLDPNSVESVRQALARVLESEELRRELGTRGRKKAEQFRWEVAAQKTWEFWQKL